MLDQMLLALKEAWQEVKRDVWYFIQRVILRRTFLPAPTRGRVYVDLRRK